MPSNTERIRIEAACDAAYELIHKRFDLQDRRKQCLHWSIAMVAVLQEHGYRSCLNAGTANFLADHSAKEPVPSHYGYFWQDHCPTDIDKFLECGILPEMHVWSAIPDLNMIVDPTTRFLPELATEAGVHWKEPNPPSCLWATADTLPSGWFYTAHENACHVAYYLSMKLSHEALCR